MRHASIERHHMVDEHEESHEGPLQEKTEPAFLPSLKLLYGIIVALLLIIVLLLMQLYDAAFDSAFFDAQYRASRTIRRIERWYHQEEQDNTPSIQRANFYAYGGITIDVRNVPEGGVEPLVNGKDISGTLENIGSFVSDDDGMTYERYDFVGSMKDMNITTGINEIVIRYASITLPAYKLKVTEREKKDYEKTYHKKLRQQKKSKQGN